MINLLLSVKVLPTAVSSADDIASSIMKNHQLARTALQKAELARLPRARKDAKKDHPFPQGKLKLPSDPNPMGTRLDETTNELDHG